MRLLLDTHIFLWLITNDDRLTADLRNAISDSGNDVYLSVISIWESIIKHQIGKLPYLNHPIPICLNNASDTSLPVFQLMKRVWLNS